MKRLLKPNYNPYTDWKNKFMKVRGQDFASMIMTEATDSPLFPLSRTSNLKVIVDFNFSIFTLAEQEVVNELTDFKFVSFPTFSTRD